MSMITRLQAMLDSGQDNALLRFTLGGQLLKEGDLDSAIAHLKVAVRHDPGYSAAWKMLGKALQESGDHAAARDVYLQGIEAAHHNGDVQAAKEMQVFLRRAERALAEGDDGSGT
jgi:Tfp pilus assembly protein PilF